MASATATLRSHRTLLLLFGAGSRSIASHTPRARNRPWSAGGHRLRGLVEHSFPEPRSAVQPAADDRDDDGGRRVLAKDDDRGDRQRARRAWSGALLAARLLGRNQTARTNEFTTELATLEPPPPELQQLLAAIAGNQGAMDGFAQVNGGVTSPAEFFRPANVARMMSVESAVR